jgi:hypothetical protein
METISRQIADALDAGQIPWRMSHYPRQIVSGRLFAGVNPILLQIAAARMNSTSPWWATKMECELCRHMVVVGPDDGVQLPDQKENVFNLEQQPDRGFEPPELPYRRPAVVFDTLVREAGIKIEYDDEAICQYERDKDLIRIPYPFLFADDCFFHALSHEIFHFTERRMGWPAAATTPQDELRAEIGASFLCAVLGVKPLAARYRSNHDKFVQTWAADMRANPGLLFEVCNNVTATISGLLRFVGMEVRWEMNSGNWMSHSGETTANTPCT